MSAIQPARSADDSRLTSTTAAAQVFEAELAHQRIDPEQAVTVVELLTQRPVGHVEGFVTIDAVRALVAKLLYTAKETVCGGDADSLMLVANEVAPTFPYVDLSGEWVWACCVSAIGTLCDHRLTPGERQILSGKQDDAGRWVRRDRDGEQVESTTASQMRQFLTKTPATGFGTVEVTGNALSAEVSSPPATELGVHKTLVYRWEPLGYVHAPPLPPPGYDVHGPGSDYDDNGNWRAAPPLSGAW